MMDDRRKQIYARALVDPRVEVRDHRDATHWVEFQPASLIVVHVQYVDTARAYSVDPTRKVRITVENFALTRLGTAVFDGVGDSRAEILELAIGILTRSNLRNLEVVLDTQTYSTAGYTVSAET